MWYLYASFRHETIDNVDVALIGKYRSSLRANERMKLEKANWVHPRVMFILLDHPIRPPPKATFTDICRLVMRADRRHLFQDQETGEIVTMEKRPDGIWRELDRKPSRLTKETLAALSRATTPDAQDELDGLYKDMDTAHELTAKKEDKIKWRKEQERQARIKATGGDHE